MILKVVFLSKCITDGKMKPVCILIRFGIQLVAVQQTKSTDRGNIAQTNTA